MLINRKHLYFWVPFISIILAIDYFQYGEVFRLDREMLMFALEIWTFYSLVYALFLFKKNSSKQIFKATLVVIISLSVTFLLTWCRGKLALYHGVVLFKTTKLMFISFLLLVIRFGLNAAGYFFLVSNFQKQKALDELANQKLLLEKQLADSEANFLRAQINPHFLQNCLNFLYQDTRKSNPNAAKAIVILSDLMRFSATESPSPSGLQTLSTELTQVNNLIELSQLRFNGKLLIRFEQSGNVAEKWIAPMIMLTLVENVLKYADFYDADFPAQINAKVNESNQTVVFSTKNKKAYSSPTSIKSTGIGLKNITDRLNILWQNNYTLDVKDRDTSFEVLVTMPYKTKTNTV